MSLGYTSPLYLLAFDHRGVFARTVLDTTGEPTPDQERIMVDAKELIFAGARRAADAGVAAPSTCGILVDELYGASVARHASTTDLVVVMPVEAPDREVFDFAYGEDFGAHVESFSPDFAKVLVRYNADGDAADNDLQAGRLRRLSQWLRARDHKLLFELIVPATEAQLALANGDVLRFELEQRPALIVRAMAALQAAGVEPDVWKLEGLDTVPAAQAAAAQAQAGEGREQVVCTVLGAGAGVERVERWLSVAAAVDGFAGFAIGRSIWRDAVRGYLGGTLDRDRAAQQIGDNYLRFLRVYLAAEHAPAR